MNIVGVIAEHVGLQRHARRYIGYCPFHNDDYQSLSVNPDLGLWHCFGCGAGGDAAMFQRLIKPHDIPECPFGFGGCARCV